MVHTDSCAYSSARRFSLYPSTTSPGTVLRKLLSRPSAQSEEVTRDGPHGDLSASVFSAEDNKKMIKHSPADVTVFPRTHSHVTAAARNASNIIEQHSTRKPNRNSQVVNSNGAKRTWRDNVASHIRRKRRRTLPPWETRPSSSQMHGTESVDDYSRVTTFTVFAAVNYFISTAGLRTDAVDENHNDHACTDNSKSRNDSVLFLHANKLIFRTNENIF